MPARTGAAAHRVVVVVSVAAVLVVSACGSDGDDPTGAPSDTPASDTPAPWQRTATLTEPVAIDFECERYCAVVGDNGDDRVALLDSVAGVSTDPSAPARDPQVMRVLDADGEVVWDFDEFPQIEQGIFGEGPFAVGREWAHAYESAVVVSAEDNTLRGLDWSNGSELWEMPANVTPDTTLDHPDSFLLRADYEEEDRTLHTLGLFSAASRDELWQAEEVDSVDIADDSSYLVAATFGKNGAELVRVNVDDGATTSVDVPSWKGTDGQLMLHNDGALSKRTTNDADEVKLDTVQVDWEAGTVEDIDPDRTPDTDDVVPGYPEAHWIATHHDSGLVLAATVGGNSEPEAVFAVDADGQQLWERPAAEVATWYLYDADDGKVPEFWDMSLYSVGEANPIVVLGARPTPADEDLDGVGAGEEGPGYVAYDLRTGEDLWEWGNRTRNPGLTVFAEHGLALASMGSFDEDTPPGELAALDLQTGEPDWTFDGDAAATAWLTDGESDGFGVAWITDGPWLLSTVVDQQ